MRRRLPHLLFVLAWLLATAIPAGRAADGTPDPSFSGDGRVLTDLGHRDRALAVAVDATGRIVAAGESIERPQGARLAVARYLPDGTLDPSFGSDGMVVSDAEDGLVVKDLVIDAAGRILLTGMAPLRAAGDEFAAVRLLPDGSFDPTFGGDGFVRTGVAANTVEAIALDSAGRILLGGMAKRDFAVLRLNPDGSTDDTFGSGGLANVSLATPDEGDVAYEIVVMPDGKITAVGVAYMDVPEETRHVGHFALLRLLPNGTPDPSFGDGDGIVLDRVAPRGAYAVAAVRDGGEVIAGGRGAGAPRYRLSLARYASDGSRATFFGNEGVVHREIRRDHEVSDLALDSRRRIVAALTTYGFGSRTAGPFLAARLRRGGFFDPAFGGDGIVATGFGRFTAFGSAVAVAGDDDVVLAGVAKRPDSFDTDFALARHGARDCRGRGATIVGTGGRDRLVGTPRRDVIVAGDGADRILGGAGNDLICGGRGLDRITAGGGNDLVIAGPGNDRIYLKGGSDRASGNNGDDLLGGSDGADRLFGGNHGDRVLGAAGPDRLFGNRGSDTVLGGPGNDVVRGNRGRDRVGGGGGRDSVRQ